MNAKEDVKGVFCSCGETN